MEFDIALIEGDGIGPEISAEAVKILESVEIKYDHKFNIKYVVAAGEAIDKFNDPLPPESLDICKKSNAVIIANLGGSKWSKNTIDKMPEKALVSLRKEIGAKINIRPIKLNKELKEFSPLKPEIIDSEIDVIVIRDIAGGMIPGEKTRCTGLFEREASDLEYYNEKIIKNIAVYGFEFARNRNKKLSSLDKANVLASSKLWREIVTEVSKDYPDVKLEHLLVDNAAMEVLKRPCSFDVIITSNMFGDIIADEISQITGVATILASIEISDTGKGIYTPNQLHYPDESIIGLNKANPIGLIKSAAAMLKYSFGLGKEAGDIENCIDYVIAQGFATEDIYKEGKKILTTSEMGDVIKNILLEQ